MAKCAKCEQQFVTRSMSTLVGHDPVVGELRVLVCSECRDAIFKGPEVSMGCNSAPEPELPKPDWLKPGADLSAHLRARITQIGPKEAARRLEAFLGSDDEEDEDLKKGGMLEVSREISKNFQKKLRGE